MKYFCVVHDRQRQYCSLAKQPEEVADICYRFIEGLPEDGDYPEDAEFVMSDSSGGIAVPDFVHNPFGYFIVSEKLKALLDDLKLALAVEYLPLKIINHKGRAHSGGYFLMNMLGSFDCLDLQATQAEIDVIEPQFFQWIDKLVLCDKKMENAPHIFRVKEFPHLMIVSEWLMAQMQEIGLTGMSFVPSGADYEYS